ADGLVHDLKTILRNRVGEFPLRDAAEIGIGLDGDDAKSFLEIEFGVLPAMHADVEDQLIGFFLHGDTPSRTRSKRIWPSAGFVNFSVEVPEFSDSYSSPWGSKPRSRTLR